MSSAEATLSSLDSDRHRGLTMAEAAARLARQGPNEVSEKPRHPIRQFARKFWGLSAWMIELIALLSFFLHKQADLAVALALLIVNAVLSFVQEQRASAAVQALRRKLHVSGRVVRDGVWRTMPARELVRGDIIRVRGGDFVPADAQLLDGSLAVDQSALTGESQDVQKTVDEVLYSGSVVRQGEATAVVTATGVATFFGRTTDLVEQARPRLHVEDVIARVVRWLFLIVGVLVSVAVIVSVLEGLRLVEILPLALVLLMSAVPVALPVMFTVSMAIGSVELARRGVMVTRLSAAEDAAHMDVLCADKTGTLTLNRLSLVDAVPQPGFSLDDVVRDGAWASNEANQDPIDLAFLRAAGERALAAPERTVAFIPFSPTTRRTEATVVAAGQSVRVMKGALATIAEAAGVSGYENAVLEQRAAVAAHRGYRVLAVARAEIGHPVRFVGLALLRDTPRPDSRDLIDRLKSLGVAVKMLTGDALPAASAVASELGLGDIRRAAELRAVKDHGVQAAVLAERSGGFAEVFPEDKFLIVKSLQSAGHVVGMTGDGINDAPALRQAEVGIAVEGATDVAKGAASAVLTTEGLANAVELVTNGRAIYQRVLTWIVNKISRTILKSGFVVLAFLVTGRFVISALGMVMLVFMTDFVKIALATDRVHPSQQPESWNIAPLVRVAAVLGVVMMIESLGLLALAWSPFGLGTAPGRLQMFSFQVLLFFALFSIVSIRERRRFWSSRPSRALTLALCSDALVGVAIAAHGMGELRPLPPGQLFSVVAFAFLTALIVNDFVKAALISRITRKTARR